MEKYKADDKSRVLSRDEVRGFDKWAIEEAGVPGVVLMENAGRSSSEIIFDKLKENGWERVGIFCGTGNNGGDGFVIARHLMNGGIKVKVVVCGDTEKIKGDAKINYDIAVKMGADIVGYEKEVVKTYNSDMIVDALFGTGLKRELKEEYQEIIREINGLGKYVVAVDIPSGIDCDSGEVLGEAVKADVTVSFVAVKKGFATARKYTGEVWVAGIGISPESRK